MQFKQWSEKKATDSTNIRGEAELCQLLLHSLEAFPMRVLLYPWFVSQNNIDNNSFTSTDEAEIFEPGRNNNFNEIEKPQENLANAEREKEVLLLTNKQVAKELVEAWAKYEQIESELTSISRKRNVFQTGNEQFKNDRESTRRIDMIRGLQKNVLSPTQMNYVFFVRKVNN